MLRLNYGGVLYDRSLALIAGRAGDEIQLDYEVVPEIGELFRRVCGEAEFEAAEISLSTLTAMVSRGDDRYVGIPVFPSRCFRHSFVFVRSDRGIKKPADLAGKLVGIEEYQMTAAVWIRAFLEHDYGVPAAAMRWRTGGLMEPGNQERLHVDLPPEVELETIPEDRALEEMLFAGDLDALVATQVPAQLRAGAPGVKRLFPDYREVEREYLQRTGIFPIMHTTAIRRDVYERRPDAAPLLLAAFRRAQEMANERLWDLNALAVPLPWLGADLDELEDLFDGNAFPIGYEPNEGVLSALTQYSFEQGLSARKVDPRELFAPETLAA